MSQNNITQISQYRSGLPDGGAVTLDSVKVAINAWRETKKTSSEKIPPAVWDQIFHLLEIMPESNILTALNISRRQVETERQRRHQGQAEIKNKDISTSAPIEAIDFCEAQPRQPEQVPPVAYKPAKTFSTTTSVVEIYRPDGGLLKIHICTERFSELLSAFFKA